MRNQKHHPTNSFLQVHFLRESTGGGVGAISLHMGSLPPILEYPCDNEGAMRDLGEVGGKNKECEL